ncbi:hypothetical protein M6D93_12490 [Jatrophihabitans telluris]|uniref:Uncharacterized protein n=1 Tax=Jatrophihabitans telluris TaxID=2038343 RepID=A0ABY4QV01_9ACTN|nr:hypothetical protein [Jatrophihabitans telluris]UQX87119.1 hypothetical protein M6D93_12490 [Jatrophihabitans telluris]
MTPIESTVTITPEILADFPTWCPKWCTKNHTAEFEEGGEEDMPYVLQHFDWPSSQVLSELRNSYDDRVERAGGGSWDIVLAQNSLPSTHKGYNGPPIVQLDTRDSMTTSTSLLLTSGDARVLAAQLIAADKIDQ